MILKVGDDDFGMICVDYMRDDFEGEFYISVSGVEFGSKLGSFDLKQFFMMMESQLFTYNSYVPDLWGISPEDIFEYLDSVWNDSEIDGCPVVENCPDSFDRPEDILSKIIFYGGGYAFDGVDVVVVSNNEQSHFMIRSGTHGTPASVVIPRNHFNFIFKELYLLWKEIRRI